MKSGTKRFFKEYFYLYDEVLCKQKVICAVTEDNRLIIACTTFNKAP